MKMLFQLRVLSNSLFIFTLLVIAVPAGMCQDNYRPELAVVSFTDSSIGLTGKSNHNRTTNRESALIKTLMAYIEISLQNSFQLLEREKLDTLIRELKLTKEKVISQRSAVRLGQLTGAKLLLTGNITENSNEKQNSEYHGVKREFIYKRLAVVFKVLNTQTGEIIFADEVNRELLERGSSVGSRKSASNTKSSRIVRQVAQEIGKKVEIHLSELALIASEESQKKSIVFQSVPSGAMLDLDGIHIGTTPHQTMFLPGEVVKVTLSKAGYKSISKTIKVTEQDDQTINIELSSLNINNKE